MHYLHSTWVVQFFQKLNYILFVNDCTKPLTKSIWTTAIRTTTKALCIDYMVSNYACHGWDFISLRFYDEWWCDVTWSEKRVFDKFVYKWKIEKTFFFFFFFFWNFKPERKFAFHLWVCNVFIQWLPKISCRYILQRRKKHTFEKFSGQTIKMLLENYQKRICCIMRPVHTNTHTHYVLSPFFFGFIF